MRSQAAADCSHELMSPRDEQSGSVAVAMVAVTSNPSLHFSCTAVKSCPQCTAHTWLKWSIIVMYTLLLSTVPKLEGGVY